MLPILTWPHPMLGRSLRAVTPEEMLTDEFFAKCGELAETMMAYRGLGLAACQIGWDARVFVLAQNESAGKGLIRQGAAVYVNPVVLATSGDELATEGCLSFPGAVETMHGPTGTRLAFTTLHGDDLTQDMRGWQARGALHETQHLEGKTMLDRMGQLQRRLFLKNYARAQTKARRA